MPTPGYVFRDGGPIPDDELKNKITTTGQTQDVLRTPSKPVSISTTSPVNTPTSSRSTFSSATESHALANADHDEKGAAQNVHNETEVKDLGWNDHPDDVPKPLVGGLPNEELWLLVRRFNKVTNLGINQEIYTEANRVANVPCQGDERGPSRRTRSQHCGRRRVLARQVTGQH